MMTVVSTWTGSAEGSSFGLARFIFVEIRGHFWRDPGFPGWAGDGCFRLAA